MTITYQKLFRSGKALLMSIPTAIWRTGVLSPGMVVKLQFDSDGVFSGIPIHDISPNQLEIPLKIAEAPTARIVEGKQKNDKRKTRKTIKKIRGSKNSNQNRNVRKG